MISQEALSRLYSPTNGNNANLGQQSSVIQQKCNKCGVDRSRYEAHCECDRNQTKIEPKTTISLKEQEAIKVIEIRMPVTDFPKAPAIIDMDENGERKRYARFREKKFVCDVCEHSFTMLQNVAHHFYLYHHPGRANNKVMKRTGNTPSKNFQCTKCEKIFPTHERALLSKRNHSCPECKKVYSTGSQLNQHIAAVHRNERFLCHLCPLDYSSKCGLIRHIDAIHENKVHKCTFKDCPHPGFKCPKALAAHIRIHTGDRPFKCGECGRAFTRKNDLRAHQKTHAFSPSLTCSKCPQRFLKRFYRDKHEEKCTAVAVKAEMRWGGAYVEAESNFDGSATQSAINPDMPLVKQEVSDVYGSFLANG